MSKELFFTANIDKKHELEKEGFKIMRTRRQVVDGVATENLEYGFDMDQLKKEEAKAKEREDAVNKEKEKKANKNKGKK